MAVIVTGGSGGIGQAIAQSLIATGTPVIVLDRVPPAVATESHLIDVCDLTAVERVVSEIAACYGRIEALICAAGVVSEYQFTELTMAEWRRVLDASLTAAFVTTHLVLPFMLPVRQGNIIAFSSGYATSGYSHGAHYAAAKAGLEALMKSVALEYSGDGIRANCIAPGPIRTAMLKEERITVVTPRIPMRRVGEPIDVVGAVRFLLSDDSAYITGQTIHVNGGLLMP